MLWGICAFTRIMYNEPAFSVALAVCRHRQFALIWAQNQVTLCRKSGIETHVNNMSLKGVKGETKH